MHDRTVTGFGQFIGFIPIIRYIATDGTKINRQRSEAILGHTGNSDIGIVTEIGIGMIDLGTSRRIDLRRAVIAPLEYGDELSGGHQVAQLGDDAAE